MPEFNYDDVPTAGHMLLQRRRQLLTYFRTIEFEVPKLAAFREEYKPPSAKQLLRFRFVHFQGEAHPHSAKVVLTVDVAQLFGSGLLKSAEAKKNFLLLAGTRFNPRDVEAAASGNMDAVTGEVKISCDQMPNDRQNMKWCSDTFDKLIHEANNPSAPEISQLPVDLRHYLARQHKKNRQYRAKRATFRDFPKEWL
jgi:small subunit ribosomal protein S35